MRFLKVVISTIEDNFPDAVEVKWKKINITYQTTFEDAETTMTQFTPKGKWIKTVVIVIEYELPRIATEYLEQNYENAQVSVVQIEESNKEEIIYLLIIEMGDEKIKKNYEHDRIVIDK